jgi:hypothetical protein
MPGAIAEGGVHDVFQGAVPVSRLPFALFFRSRLMKPFV